MTAYGQAAWHPSRNHWRYARLRYAWRGCHLGHVGVRASCTKQMTTSRTDGTLAVMSCWQYAQLMITIEGRAPRDDARTVLWHGPGHGIGENYSDGDETVPELLNRFGADGWELTGLQEHREGGRGGSYWDASWSRTIYTFKRPVPP